MKVDQERLTQGSFQKVSRFLPPGAWQPGGHTLGNEQRERLCRCRRQESVVSGPLREQREAWADLLPWGPPALTFEGGLGACDEEELLVLLALPLLADVVTHRVAATLPAAQAQALAEAAHVAALVGRALPAGVQHGVDEEMHGPLVGAFYGLSDGWNTGQEGHYHPSVFQRTFHSKDRPVLRADERHIGKEGWDC